MRSMTTLTDEWIYEYCKLISITNVYWVYKSPHLRAAIKSIECCYCHTTPGNAFILLSTISLNESNANITPQSSPQCLKYIFIREEKTFWLSVWCVYSAAKITIRSPHNYKLKLFFKTKSSRTTIHIFAAHVWCKVYFSLFLFVKIWNICLDWRKM